MVAGLGSPGGPADAVGMALDAPHRADVRTHRIDLGEGAATTVHVAAYPRALVAATVVVLPAPEPLAGWCARTGVRDALVGGFFVTPGGPPLGEVWTGGRRAPTRPFDADYAPIRSCLHVDDERVTIAPLGALPAGPVGDLLQAGPALVAGGRVLVTDAGDPEGFAAGVSQFDSDITAGRHPRAALGIDGERLSRSPARGAPPARPA